MKNYNIYNRPELDELPERLKGFREAKGLTQVDLADKANLDSSGLSKIERGSNVNISFVTLCRLADALDLTLDQLAGRT